MAVIATILGGAVTVAAWTVGLAFLYAIWSDVASPLTVYLLAWATTGVLVNQLVITDRPMETWEGVAIGGAVAAGMGLVNVSGLTSSLTGRV